MRYKSPVKQKSCDMYVKKGCTQTEIAKTLKISRNTTRKWIKKHNWDLKREEEREKQRRRIQMDRLTNFIKQLRQRRRPIW